MKTFYIALLCLLLGVNAHRDLRQTFAQGEASSDTEGGSAIVSGDVTDTTTLDDGVAEPSGLIDIYLLVDTTEAVPGTNSIVQSQAAIIVSALFGLADGVYVGVGQYEDDDSDGVTGFSNLLSVTGSGDAVVGALAGLNFVADVNIAESQFTALQQIANSAAGFRTGSLRIVVWIGDTQAIDEIDGTNLNTVIASLNNAGVHVVVLDTGSLNSEGEAANIAQQTNGVLFTRNESGVFEATFVAQASGGSSASVSASGSTFTSTTTAIDGSGASITGPLNFQDAIVAGVGAVIAVSS